MVLSGSFSHQTVVSEWSLDSVNKMIDACRNAILGGPAPEGIEKGDDADKAKDAMAQITGVNEIIASAAFNAVQGLLRSAGSRTSVETKSSVRSVPLAPGIRLFIAVVENSYDKKYFFGRDSIVQTMFVFDARHSLEEGKKRAEMTGLVAISDLSAAYASQLRDVSREIAKLDILDDDYDPKIDRLEKIQDRLKVRMKEIDAEIVKLGGSPVNRAGLLESVEAVRRNTAGLRSACLMLPEI